LASGKTTDGIKGLGLLYQDVLRPIAELDANCRAELGGLSKVWGYFVEVVIRRLL
jgi:hypothetical protein